MKGSQAEDRKRQKGGGGRASRSRKGSSNALAAREASAEQVSLRLAVWICVSSLAGA